MKETEDNQEEITNTTPIEHTGRGGCNGVCDICNARECTATLGHPFGHRCDVCD